MGTLLYFCETTLLWIVAFFLLAGLGWRLFFFVLSIFRRRTLSKRDTWYRFLLLVGALFAFHRAVLKKPVYTALRYVFHACLFIVPIWFSGHIYLWEESRFEWYWRPLPDAWADWMTIAVLCFCAFFMIRRAIWVRRLEARISDFAFIAITALPFLTGYFHTHGTLDSIGFFENYLWYMHVISAEILLVTIVVLFCRTRLNKETCVGCAACVENCPTETLSFMDQGQNRIFRYSHYQCICCGACVNVCPEQAAGLHHDIHPANLIQVLSKAEIRRVELNTCEMCGVRLAPTPQLGKLYRSFKAEDIELDTLNYCQRCKNLRVSMQIRATIFKEENGI